VKAQTLQNLAKGDLRFWAFLRLVFIRVIKVVLLCLVLTLIVYLLWQGKFTLGSFLAGAAFGLVAFLIRTRFKPQVADQNNPAGSEQKDSPAEIRPKTSVGE
jgi:O-antigen ligase